MSTRRQFLAVSSAAALASTLPRNAFALRATEEVFSNRNLGAYAQGLLSYEHFQPLVGSEFRVFLANGSVAHLKLIAVVDRTLGAPQQTVASPRGGVAPPSAVRGGPVAASPTAFDLQFSINGTVLEQDSYTMDHASLGRFAAFLVPGTSLTGAPRCTMSFNYATAALPVAEPPRGLRGAPVSATPSGTYSTFK